MSRSFKKTPIDKIHIGTAKVIANRIYRRHVNAGDYDELPVAKKSVFKRVAVDSWEVVDDIYYYPFKDVKREINNMKRNLERNGGPIIHVQEHIQKYWVIEDEIILGDKLPFVERTKLIPAHDVVLFDGTLEQWITDTQFHWFKTMYWK